MLKNLVGLKGLIYTRYNFGSTGWTGGDKIESELVDETTSLLPTRSNYSGNINGTPYTWSETVMFTWGSRIKCR